MVLNFLGVFNDLGQMLFNDPRLISAHVLITNHPHSNLDNDTIPLNISNLTREAIDRRPERDRDGWGGLESEPLESVS